MKKPRWHLIRQEFCIRTSLIYVVPSVFIAITKFIPVKLSEVMKKCFIKHLEVVIMTNLIYLQEHFQEESCKDWKIRFLKSSPWRICQLIEICPEKIGNHLHLVCILLGRRLTDIWVSQVSTRPKKKLGDGGNIEGSISKVAKETHK